MNNPTNLAEVLQEHAARKSQQNAYTFLINDQDALSISYGQLDAEVRTLAAQLQHRQAKGQRAVLLYPPGYAFTQAFLACLYAGVVAVPAYPLKPRQGLDRLAALLMDAQATLILTTEKVHQALNSRLETSGATDQIEVIVTDIPQDPSLAFQYEKLSSDHLAFLQYTSGSTGTPKGVMVSHANLMHNQQVIQQTFGHHSDSIVVGWLPMYHDMGLIGNMLQPLYVGFPCVLIPPIQFIQKPIRWLKAISQYQATTSGGPNFAYALCVQKVTEEALPTLDLSSWDLAFNGAEPIRAATLKAFSNRFTACGFRETAFFPCYGMAETTLMATGAEKSVSPEVLAVDDESLKNGQLALTENNSATQQLVGCGRPVEGMEIRIVDPQTLKACEENQVGEIWVKGPSVTQGYWQKEALTKETFKAFINATNEGPFLRTGDLGTLSKGQLFVTGRIKELLIIRGKNHYPYDLEHTIQQHEVLKQGCGAAFTIEEKGDNRLVIMQEVKREWIQDFNAAEMTSWAKEQVTRVHGLQLYDICFVKPNTVFKTSSGKIQRGKCKQRYVDGELEEATVIHCTLR